MMTFHRPETVVAMLLLGAGIVIAGTAAVAQGASPHAFLESIYKVYRNHSNTKGIDINKPDVIRRYFAPPLAKAILKDQAGARKRNEAPLLDGDPFIDAQDWSIADLNVDVKSADRRHATGTVTFINESQPRTVVLDLVKTGDGWRISDIKAPSGSLREHFKVK